MKNTNTNTNIDAFKALLEQELRSAGRSPYDEWSKSLLFLRDSFDGLFANDGDV